MKEYKEIPNKYLKYYKEYTKKLDDLYYAKRDIFDEKWIDIKNAIAGSIASLYMYSLDLFKRKFIKETQTQDFRFYGFYFDLILSKAKHSFFTETPKESIIDITGAFNDKIVHRGLKLFQLDLFTKEFDIAFQKFIFAQFLMYDFIYYKEEGVFTRFRVDDNIFKRVVHLFQYNCDISVRSYGKNLIVKYLNIFLKNQVESQDVEESISYIYKQFVEESKKQPKFLEPFTYFLAFKVWKIAKLFQSTLEFENKYDRKNIENELKGKIKIYIEKNIDSITKFYEKAITNNQLLYHIHEEDRNLIKDFVFQKILVKYYDKGIKPLKTCVNYNDYLETTRTSRDVVLKDIFKKMISNKERERFRFDRILRDQEVRIEQIDSILQYLLQFVDEKDVQFVGLLRSGILLAHCLNILKGNKSPVLMFSSFPYISILPRSRTLLDHKDKIVLIDESIKSGLTAVMASVYLNKLKKTFDAEFDVNKLIVLADFVDFEKKPLDLSYNALCNLKAVNGRILVDDTLIDQDKINNFNWGAFFSDLKPTELKIDDFRITIEGHHRLDVTHVLSDTIRLFQVARDFANKIKTLKKAGHSKIILYATSDEGKVIVDAIIFAYKAIYPDEKIEFIVHKYKAKHKLDEFYLIFVDMTIDTMHTLKRSLKIDFEIDLDTSRPELFKIFTVFCREDAATELGDKIEWLQKY